MLKNLSNIFLFMVVLVSISACDQLANEDIKEIKENQKVILEELKEIKKSIASGPRRAQQQPQPFKEVVMDVDTNYFKGDKNAPITLIEFSDFQCPFCGRHVKNTYPQIEKEYIKTGKVKYMFADYPLGFHKQAPKASEAALCAGDQDKFWEMHDVLFNNQRALQPENLSKYAEQAGVGDMAKFNECLEKETYKETVSENFADGTKLGVRGTPSFFLGYSTPDNKNVKFTKMVRGAVPFANFKAEIDGLLNDQEAAKKN